MRFRNYQQYAIDSIYEYFESGGKGNPIVVMPTGTGKSLVLAGFIKETLRRYPGQRILKLTHVKELIEQNHRTLISLWPSAPAGVYSSGLGRKDIGYPITFAGIASAARKPQTFGWVDLVLIDECHLVSPKANTQYRKLLEALREVNPKLRVIGLTATHFRLGQGLLTQGEGRLFTDICVDMSRLSAFNWFIEEGYLLPLVPRATSYTLDLSDVGTVSGDYNQKDLQRTLDRQSVTEAALQEAVNLSAGRKHWLVFASGVDHAVHISEHLNSIGVPSTYIHAKMSDDERDERLRDYKAGRYTAMVNNGILTTGFDFPAMDLIVMLRPTQSPGLWVQMLGRGTRPCYADGFDLETAEGRHAAIGNSHKQNCLVLDFAGNTPRLGPINDPVLPKPKGSKGLGAPPVRLCPECETYCHASLRVCPNCDYEFPREIKFNIYAGTDELVANESALEQPNLQWFDVDRITYERHERPGKPVSMVVTYYCGLRRFKEWVCFEHTGYAFHRARSWWRKIWTWPMDNPEDQYYPSSVSNALECLASYSSFSHPSAIKVWVKGGKNYSEVLDHSRTENSNEWPTIEVNGKRIYDRAVADLSRKTG